MTKAEMRVELARLCDGVKVRKVRSGEAQGVRRQKASGVCAPNMWGWGATRVRHSVGKSARAR